MILEETALYGFDYSSSLGCPCKGCAKRHLGCHGECAEYAEFQKSNEEIKRKRNQMQFEQRCRAPLNKARRRK